MEKGGHSTPLIFKEDGDGVEKKRYSEKDRRHGCLGGGRPYVFNSARRC